jgi:methionine-rich copper-binding protein CopC
MLQRRNRGAGGLAKPSDSRMRRLQQILLLSSILFPSLASAHAYLVKSVPAGRATLFASPVKIQLWFNERLESRYSSVSVTDPDGKRVDLDNAQVLAEDPKQLAIGIKTLRAGKYTVKFRVLSVDGHVVEQSFPFTIRESKN